MSEWNAGEVGGVVAGILAFLAALGKGAAWLFDWKARRTEARTDRLLAWEASLDRREREQREDVARKFREIDAEVQDLRSQQRALGFSLLEVTVELRTHVTTSPALTRAAQALRLAFPIEMGMPPEMAELVRAMDGQDDMGASAR